MICADVNNFIVFVTIRSAHLILLEVLVVHNAHIHLLETNLNSNQINTKSINQHCFISFDLNNEKRQRRKYDLR